MDREGGLIISQRTTSGQWFEFWRIDAQGRYQQAESSLATIGRTVTVEVTPTEAVGVVIDPGAPEADATEGEATVTCGDYRVSVCVEKARLSMPSARSRRLRALWRCSMSARQR